jgi:hypothetical protein
VAKRPRYNVVKGYSVTMRSGEVYMVHAKHLAHAKATAITHALCKYGACVNDSDITAVQVAPVEDKTSPPKPSRK